MNIATSYVEYRCLDCGHIIWSKDNKEIETLRKLHGTGRSCLSGMPFKNAISRAKSNIECNEGGVAKSIR